MRIEWDPLDAALLAVCRGEARVHRGDHVTALATDVLDARWLADGPILAIDRTGTVRSYRDTTGIINERRAGDLHDATVSADGTTFAYNSERGGLFVEDLRGMTFSPRLDGVYLDGRPTSLALSGNGARLAIAYDTEQPGRGVAVFDLKTQKVVERTWQEQPLDRDARMGLAFDHHGKRLALALPEVGVRALGVMRIGAGELYPRRRIGGASAVAIEYRGNLVAYAHRVAPAGARGRIQFDYLDPPAKGPEIVDVVDTQTLEVELPDVVAMAFSRDRRRLACLASNGAVEVVPVP